MLVRVIEQYLNENNLRHLVHFHGAHCFSSCEKGPLMKINGREYQALNEEKVRAILNGIFGQSSASF